MLTPDQREALRALVAEERTATRERLQSLRRTFADVVEATEMANVDDEHDPEGTTIAFDRAQLVSLIETEQLHLAALDLAAAKIEMSTIEVCESCGHEIVLARLMALPTARKCIACAAGEPSNSRRRPSEPGPETA